MKQYKKEEQVLLSKLSATRSQKLFIILSSLVLALGSSSIHAATYYLDSVNGNDAASGSSSAPWRSISKAQATVASGDTVLLRNGSYGNFSQTKAYSSFVTYKAEDGAEPILGNISLGNGSAYLRFDGLAVNGTANLYGGNHVELLNCVVKYPGDRYAAPANLVDIRYTKFGVVKGCDISHGKTGIKIDNAADTTVSGNTIHDLAVDVMTATPVNNFLCEYNHAYDIHQDRWRGKDDYWAWPFVAASSQVTVSDELYKHLIVSPASGYTGILCYVNLPKPMSFANLLSLGMDLVSNVSLGSSDLFMRLSSAKNGSTSGTYIDVPISSSGAISVSAAKAMTNCNSVALVLKTAKTGAKFDINNWTGSNGAHQDFVVFSNTTGNVIIRNNIFHDGCNQGIFTSPAKGTNVTIENNLIYDMEGFNLLNLSLNGSNTIRNNTFIGYLRGPNYMDPFNKYHLNGNALVVPLDSGSGIRIYNNVVGAELTSVGGYNDWNIVTRQTTPGSHTLVISGTNPNRINLDSGFFTNIDFKRYNAKVLDYTLAPGSAAINFGTASGQAATSLGTLNESGFVSNNGPARDASHHSAGAHEPGTPASVWDGSSTGTGGGDTGDNSAPVFGSILDQSATTGTELSFDISATDADGDAITYSASDMPAGATFSGQTFKWTPSSTGTFTVIFTASDGLASASKSVTITVTSGNSAPVLTPIGNKTVNANSNLAFAINATDADGDTVTYSAANLPSGAGLNGNSFSWIPSMSQAGTYTVTFTASDGTLSDSETITITVNSDTSGGGTGTTPGITGYWKFDETSGTTSADVSGNSNTASLMSSPAWTTGLSGSGLQFTGTLPAARISMSGITAGQGSVSVWARPSGFTTNPNYLFGHATSDWGNRIQLFCNSSGGLCLGLGDMHFRASNIMTLPSNAWSHVALAWNGANYTVYVNGAAKASGTYTGLATIASAADFGNDGTASHNEAFNGIIDEARTYNYALSAAEVGQIYTAGSGSGSTTNHAPVLAVIGNKTVTAGSLLSFTVSATDSDNDAVTYSASGLPAGATFNSGTFSWTPSQAGTYSVTFTASDGKASDTETITITVSAGTQTGTGPVFTQIGPQTVTERSVLSFYVSAKDPSGKAVTYGIKNMPTYATFSGGKFYWRPTFDQQGTYVVTFTASNGTQTTSMDVQITVVNLDRAPIMYAIGSKTVYAGSRLSFNVKANEPDNNDTLVFSASPLPSGATFTSGAYGTFTWTPTTSQRGTYKVTFKVSDGELSDSEVVTITVK